MKLVLRTTDEFFAMLTALTQYTDNAAEVEYEFTPQDRARYEAALCLQHKMELELINTTRGNK